MKPQLLLLLLLVLIIAACSKTNNSQPATKTTILATWNLSVDSMVVYDNGTEVQRDESEFSAAGTDYLHIQFKGDGTGMQTERSATAITDTPIIYSLSGNLITINFAESDLDDLPYIYTGTVQSLTSNKLVLYVTQTTIKGSVTETTSHHMTFTM